MKLIISFVLMAGLLAAAPAAPKKHHKGLIRHTAHAIKWVLI